MEIARDLLRSLYVVPFVCKRKHGKMRIGIVFDVEGGSLGVGVHGIGVIGIFIVVDGDDGRAIGGGVACVFGRTVHGGVSTNIFIGYFECIWMAGVGGSISSVRRRRRLRSYRHLDLFS